MLISDFVRNEKDIIVLNLMELGILFVLGMIYVGWLLGEGVERIVVFGIFCD